MWKKLMTVIVLAVISSLSVAELIKEDNYVEKGHRISYSVTSAPDWLNKEDRKREYKLLRSGLRLLELEKAIGDDLYNEYENKIQHESRYNLSKMYTVYSSEKGTLYVMTLVAHPVNAVYVGKEKNDLSGWTLSCVSTNGKYSKDINSMIFSPACQKAINKYKIPLKKTDLSKFVEIKGSLN